MKAAVDFGRTLLFLISLLALVAAVRVSAQESRQKLFNATEWLEKQKAYSTKEVLALRDLVTIQYDQNLNRPWGDEGYKEQITKRWTAFRTAFCPSEIELCLLSEQAKLSSISNVLKQESTLKAINEYLKKLNNPISIVRLKTVPGVLPEDMSYLNDFNFVIGVFSTEQSAEGPYQKVGLTILMDVGSYFLGYQGKVPSVYYAYNLKKQLLVFEETLIAKALDHGILWMKASVRTDANGFLDVPNRLIKGYTQSKKSASPLYQSLANADGYEWLVYDEIKALAISQGFSLKNHWSDKLNGLEKEMLVRQSLLRLQEDFDSRLVTLLFHQHAYDENAVVLDQMTSKVTVSTVIRENVNFLVSTSREWFASANFEYLQDQESLKHFNLDLYEALEKFNLLGKDWSGLTAQQKRSIAIAAVYPRNMSYPDELKSIDNLIRTSIVDTTTLNVPAMHRLFACISMSHDPRMLAKLANDIYRKRFPSL